MENQNTSNSDKLKNIICYIPLGGIVLFFTEQNKSKELMKHIKYGTFLFIAFIVIRLIIVSIFWIPIGGTLFLLYIGVAGFIGFKAYNGEEVNIEYIDNFEKKVKENLNNDTVVKKTQTKKTETKKTEDKKDEDLLDF